jgi:hypothetical protein
MCAGGRHLTTISQCHPRPAPCRPAVLPSLSASACASTARATASLDQRLYGQRHCLTWPAPSRPGPSSSLYFASILASPHSIQLSHGPALACVLQPDILVNRSCGAIPHGRRYQASCGNIFSGLRRSPRLSSSWSRPTPARLVPATPPAAWPTPPWLAPPLLLRQQLSPRCSSLSPCFRLFILLAACHAGSRAARLGCSGTAAPRGSTLYLGLCLYLYGPRHCHATCAGPLEDGRSSQTFGKPPHLGITCRLSSSFPPVPPTSALFVVGSFLLRMFPHSPASHFVPTYFSHPRLAFALRVVLHPRSSRGAVRERYPRERLHRRRE